MAWVFSALIEIEVRSWQAAAKRTWEHKSWHWNKFLPGHKMRLVGLTVDPVNCVIEQDVGVDPLITQPKTYRSEAGFADVAAW